LVIAVSTLDSDGALPGIPVAFGSRYVRKNFGLSHVVLPGRKVHRGLGFDLGSVWMFGSVQTIQTLLDSGEDVLISASNC
jgi:hypothetical protein